MKTLHGDPERTTFAASAAKDRAGWAYRELAALLRYAAANRQHPKSIPCSIYGAIGLCQFMRGDIRKRLDQAVRWPRRRLAGS